jgi:tetratricopeptide (TPR) repeat protein
MKSYSYLIVVFCVMTMGGMRAIAQTEDVRAATGLPIQIGQSVIYGQVTLSGLQKTDKKPIIAVTLLAGGTQIERTVTNDNGYWFFLRAPAPGLTLIFEVNNVEVGRDVLNPGPDRTLRRDISVDWKRFNESQKDSPPGVVSARDMYPGRSPDASAALDSATAATKAGKKDEAIKILRSVVDKDPKDFPAWTELGTAYFSSDKFAEAEVAYNKALELKPDFMVAIMNLGKVQMSQKKYDAAVVTLTKGIQTDPNSADAFHYLGESYLQIKQGNRAVIAMNEAIRLAPNEKADLHLRLAALYNAAGAKPQAVNEYKLFLQKKPDYKDKDKLEKYIKDNS